ncbi:RrF2 family transcriptional regulator [Deinococcus cellulosilyticus]|uniref:HTH-type transcriptional repressor NsrR n=1 Tax=Deinococcus cellulosilyticus (strain DSM 18568 / NBRC 106333 / KACC 11606 / 5516J-15) TaxID=1223518 RepID=A0A511MY31_DEIC1|nr:Rrf2 family transcriptional regulator [Deinococcus cellulosilyticus]GEM45047.1 HTH-type transcriptional repressor NsrR [Deinococcus cellulosilyticus NBRC 106333 = KACC 11606]
MQVTRFTDLSLRLLMHLMQTPDHSRATVQEVADRFNVPYNHLNKVAHALSKMGIIQGSKGKNGGIRLVKAPSEVRLGDLVRLTEPQADIIDCNIGPCPLRGNCKLKCVLVDAREAFYAKLNEYTLADVAATPFIQLEAQ